MSILFVTKKRNFKKIKKILKKIILLPDKKKFIN
jgi:hypothetical protein